MCEGYVEKPLYLLIAEWMMAENRWVGNAANLLI